MMEVLAAGKNPTEENRRIHRRHLGVEHALPCFGVGEVVEKPAMVGQFLPQKAQGGEDTLQRSTGRDESPLVSNADSGKTEARRGNAGCNVPSLVVNVATVLDHPRFRAGLLPEEKKTCVLQIVQELFVFR